MGSPTVGNISVVWHPYFLALRRSECCFFCLYQCNWAAQNRSWLVFESQSILLWQVLSLHCIGLWIFSFPRISTHYTTKRAQWGFGPDLDFGKKHLSLQQPMIHWPNLTVGLVIFSELEIRMVVWERISVTFWWGCKFGRCGLEEWYWKLWDILGYLW